MVCGSVSKDFAHIWSIARHYCFIRPISARFRRKHERGAGNVMKRLTRALCRVARVVVQECRQICCPSAFARCLHQPEFVLLVCRFQSAHDELAARMMRTFEPQHQRMIRKSVQRFSEKIMRQQ
jgi:hypothetical protein